MLYIPTPFSDGGWMYFIGEVIDNMLVDRGDVRLIARNKLATKPRRVACHDALVIIAFMVYIWLLFAQQKCGEFTTCAAKAAKIYLLAGLAGRGDFL